MGLIVGTLGLDELLGDVLAERLFDHLVSLQRVKRRVGAAGERGDAVLLALVGVELVDVFADRVARVGSAADQA